MDLPSRGLFTFRASNSYVAQPCATCAIPKSVAGWQLVVQYDPQVTGSQQPKSCVTYVRHP